MNNTIEQSLHNAIRTSFRFFRKTKRQIINFGKAVSIIFLFFTTYSKYLNPTVVDRHPILFWIHDAIITIGFLFGFSCYLIACGQIENSTYLGWSEVFHSLLYVGIGSGIIIVLGNINDIWNA